MSATTQHKLNGLLMRNRNIQKALNDLNTLMEPPDWSVNPDFQVYDVWRKIFEYTLSPEEYMAYMAYIEYMKKL